MRNRKRNKVFFLVILLLGISIGFAALTTTLKINGNTTITKNNWSVYWDSVGNFSKTPTVVETTKAEVDENDNTKVNFEVTLNQPGDFYEFQVDAVNAGTLDAMINVVATVVNGDENLLLPGYLNLSVTYADDSEIVPYHLLSKADNSTNPATPTRERIKVRLEFDRDVDEAVMEAITDNTVVDIEIDLPYIQADDHAIDRHTFNFQVGDYFTLVPDADSYGLVKADTGYSNPQTITPNELTLWRVIKVNDDGSADAVSEYASSTEVYFEGAIGYTQLVGTLQNIAAQYAKAGYTTSTRMFGYDGQTLVIEDTTAYDGTYKNRPSDMESIEPTTGTGEELDNGVLGDTLYLKDYQLVKNLYNTMVTTKVGTSTAATYWMASRSYGSTDSTHFSFCGRYVDANGDIYDKHNIRNFLDTRFYNYMYASSVRPIITVRSDLTKASGTGVINDPYTFN